MSFITKKFFTMLAGSVLSNIVFSLVLLSDTIIAGLFLGEHAVAAINLISPVYSFAASLGMLFSLGIPILYSRAIGRFEQEEANRTLGLGLTSTIGVGIVLFALLQLGGERYLAFYQASPVIMVQARQYFFWMRLVVLFLPVATLLPGMVFADGDETLSTLSDVLSAIVNIVVSLLFARTMGLGGIGLGSLVGTIAGLAICIVHFLSARNSLSPVFSFSWRRLFAVMRYSAIDACDLLFLSVFVAIMNKFLLVRFGADSLILISVITFVSELAFFLDAVGETMTPIMSIYLTGHCYEGVRRIWTNSKWTAVLLGMATTAATWALSPLVPTILGVDDATMATTVVRGVRILACEMPFISLLYVLTSYYVLADRIRLGVVVSALYELLLSTPLCMLGAYVRGFDGMFCGMVVATAAAWYVLAASVAIRYGRSEWPLLLGARERDVDSYLFPLVAEPEQIVSAHARIEGMLIENGISPSASMRLLMLFEDLFMDIHDRNPGRTVEGECALVMSRNHLRLIEMDNGVIFKPADQDATPTSWREYVLMQLVSRGVDDYRYVKAISFNRNLFEIDLADGER